MSEAKLELTPDEAVRKLLEPLAPLGTEEISWQQSAGRVLAKPVLCDRDSPACDVSAMDGYALRLADVAPGAIPVAGEVLPGEAPMELPNGSALRIVTGAPLPPGAQMVIRREDVGQEHPETIVLRAGLTPRFGDNIRRQGENAVRGSVVLAGGVRLTPAAVSVLAAMGMVRPTVFRQVRLGILVTGSEVHPVESSPKPWELRDSNGAQLAALAAACPWITVACRIHVTDVASLLQEQLRSLLNQCDALLVTGGVSMGSHDFVPAAIRSMGADVLFHRLPIKPGKPVLAAVTRSGQPILALPGNPVSVLVTACRFAGPALRRLAGINQPIHTPVAVWVEGTLSPAALWRYLPIQMIAPGSARLVPNVSSGDMVGIGSSDGCIELPPQSNLDHMLPFYRWEW